MVSRKVRTNTQLLKEIEAIRIRAEEAEETLRAIREGEVDALLISGPGGERIFSLEGAERTYRAFVEEMSDGALTLTGDGTIYYSNSRFSEIVKTPLEKIVGTAICSWASKDNQDDCRRLFERGKSARQSGEILLRSAGGSPVPVRISITPLNLNGTVVASALITDISEKRASEEKIRKYMEELERGNLELQSFTYVAAHDLQEPLRKIQTFADLLGLKCADSIPSEASDYLRRMHETATRMKQVLNSLLQYSSLTSKPEPFEQVDLNEVVRDVVSDFELQVRDSGASVEIGNLPEIEADVGQMRQLFQNLFGNALKFRREGTQPKVKVYDLNSSGDHESEICVEDNGVGFDEKYLELIFKPFQRLHGRDEYNGVGMGLAICKKVVGRHNGKISARSHVGRGSTFIVSLPLRQKRG